MIESEKFEANLRPSLSGRGQTKARRTHPKEILIEEKTTEKGGETKGEKNSENRLSLYLSLLFFSKAESVP